MSNLTFERAMLLIGFFFSLFVLVLIILHLGGLIFAPAIPERAIVVYETKEATR